MPSASDVVTGLTNLIEDALGSSENAATKTRIHVVASVLGSLGDEFAPLLERKFDVNALLSSIQNIENGLAETEHGIISLTHALGHKANDVNTSNVSNAA